MIILDDITELQRCQSRSRDSPINNFRRGGIRSTTVKQESADGGGQELSGLLSPDFYVSSEMLYSSKLSGFVVPKDAEAVACSIVNRIISNGAQELYNTYLSAKLTKHAIEHCLQIIEYTQNQQDVLNVLPFDDSSDLEEDTEPSPPACDAWRALTVQVSYSEHHRDYNNSNYITNNSNNLVMMMATTSSKSGSILTHKRPSQYLSKQNSFHSQAIDTASIGTPRRSLHQKQSYPRHFTDYHAQIKEIKDDQQEPTDRIEEQLRVMKQRDMDHKEEKERLDTLRQLEFKQQQNRLKQGNGNTNGSNSSNHLAFDYNGQVMGVHTVKHEKFPLQTWIMSHSVSVSQGQKEQSSQQLVSKSEGDSNNSKHKKQSTEVNAVKAAVNVIAAVRSIKQQILRKDQTHGTSWSMNLQAPQVDFFDKIIPSKGVTVIKGTQVKRGDCFQNDRMNTDSASGFMRMLEEDATLRNGVQTMESDPIGEGSILSQRSVVRDGEKTVKQSKSQKNRNRLLSEYETLRLPDIYSMKEGGKVLVASNDLKEVLVTESSSNEVAAVPGLLFKKQAKQQSSDYLTPRDEYNARIVKEMATNSWGSDIYTSRKTNEGLQMKSPLDGMAVVVRGGDSYRERHVFGNVGKFPRDRLSKKSLENLTEFKSVGSIKIGGANWSPIIQQPNSARGEAMMASKQMMSDIITKRKQTHVEKQIK